MNGLSIAEALKPPRAGRSVVEHEILRISATVDGQDSAAAADRARREVLAWAQKRTGAQLPPDAWAMAGFEHLAGGRNCSAVRLKTGDVDIWAIRADDPDKLVAGRIWTHEVVVGLQGDHSPRFSVRQLVSTSEPELVVEPHSPGFVQQLAETCGLRTQTSRIDIAPWVIETDDDAAALVDTLCDIGRLETVLVLTVPEDSPDPTKPLMDAVALSRATLGVARVVVLPARFTWILTDRFERVRSVFGGAVRAYLSGFSPDADPYRHRLILPGYLATANGQVRVARWLRSIAAAESLRWSRLGVDVLAFAALRNAAMRFRQERLTSEGAQEGVQLAAAQARAEALEKDVDEAVAYQKFFSEEAQKETERAEAAEVQLRAAAYRIQQLQEVLKASPGVAEPEVALPDRWPDFVHWCDANFAGRLVLAPAARRGARQPQFEDVALAARSIVWLATVYREGRLNGADGSFRDVYFEEGIRNSPCGGDEFDFDWQGRRQTADWHIKNGGTTRDPKRALRIYYCWDPETAQVIVADMPAHRRSALT